MHLLTQRRAEEVYIIKIPKEDIDSYKRDYEGKKNQIETIDKEFFLMKDSNKIPDRERTQYMKLSGYRGHVNNKIPLPEVGEVVRGDTERHYKKKRDDSQRTYDKGKKGENQGKKQKKQSEKSIGTSFGDLLKGIKLD